MNNVRYGPSEEAWNGFHKSVRKRVEDHGFVRICEIGAGANPSFPLEFVHERGLAYSVLDISESELAKAPDGYYKVVADISAPGLDNIGPFDLMFSVMLAEHVRDGRAFHENVFRLLAPGGMACHFFPTLFAPPFLVNRLIPETLADRLLNAFAPRDKYRNAKFPAFYSWCRGPSRAQVARLERLGYDVVDYAGLYGHDGYYARIPPVRKLSARMAKYLIGHPRPLLTSYATVVLRKPA